MTVSLPLRQAVYDRAGGRCDRCWDELLPDGAWTAHHRRLKAQGGTDTLPTLLCVCYGCHLYIHNHPAYSYQQGFMVPNGRTPEGWPVQRWTGWYLPDGRRWRQIPSPHEETA